MEVSVKYPLVGQTVWKKYIDGKPSEVAGTSYRIAIIAAEETLIVGVKVPAGAIISQADIAEAYSTGNSLFVTFEKLVLKPYVDKASSRVAYSGSAMSVTLAVEAD